MTPRSHSDTPHEGYYEHAREEVIALIPDTARVVVDVGCGAGALGRRLKQLRPGVQVRGIEIVADQAERARAHLDAVHVGDAGAGLPTGWPQPDCIVFADVLEHLQDPWGALRAWRGQLQDGGHIVVSLPNVLHAGVMRALLRGRWDYADEGILDRTHLRFFTRLTIIEMIENAGFEVVDMRRRVDLSPLGVVGKLLGAMHVLTQDVAAPLTRKGGLRDGVAGLGTTQYLVRARVR